MRRFLLILLSLYGFGYLQAQTPDLARSYYHFSLGKMHELQRDYRQAISEFEKAVSHDPDSAPLRVKFAETLWKGREVRRAIDECQKAIELEPEYTAPHFLLGQIYSTFRGGNQENMLEKAIQEYERTVELDSEHFEALFELGRLHFVKENYPAAVQIFDRFLQLQPWMVQASWMKARAHTELDELDRAIETLEGSLNYDESNLENLKLLGKLYEQTEQYDKARELYNRLLEESADPDVQFRFALLLSDQKQFSEAVSILQELAAKFPKHVQIKIALGRAQKGQKRYAEAAKAFRKVLEIDSTHFRANYELAETQALLGQRQEALDRFLNLLELSESSQDRTSIQVNLGFLYQDMRQFDKAVEIFQTVVRENADDDIAALRLVYALKESGELEKALSLSDRMFRKYENKAYAEEPTKNYFVIAHAQILSAADEVGKAVGFLKKEIAKHSEPEPLYLAASQLYVEHKEYDDAEKIIKQALDRLGESEKLQFQLGAVYEREGEVDQAEAVFGKILEKNPEHAGVLNYLGYMLAEQGVRLQEALDYITKAVEIDPHNGAYLDSLGWVYFKLDRLDQAEVKLSEAIRLNDADPTIYDHMGDVYNKLGQYDKARKYYEQSILFSTEKEEQKKVKKKLVEVTRKLSQKER